jgi:hypothetical protein
MFYQIKGVMIIKMQQVPGIIKAKTAGIPGAA